MLRDSVQQTPGGLAEAGHKIAQKLTDDPEVEWAQSQWWTGGVEADGEAAHSTEEDAKSENAEADDQQILDLFMCVFTHLPSV